MPKLDGILETAIHTEDSAIYEDVLGLEPIYSHTERHTTEIINAYVTFIAPTSPASPDAHEFMVAKGAKFPSDIVLRR